MKDPGVFLKDPGVILKDPGVPLLNPPLAAADPVALVGLLDAPGLSGAQLALQLGATPFEPLCLRRGSGAQLALELGNTLFEAGALLSAVARGGLAEWASGFV